MDYSSRTSGSTEFRKILYIVKISLSLTIIRTLREDIFHYIFSSYFSDNFLNLKCGGVLSPFTQTLTVIESNDLCNFPQNMNSQSKFVNLLRIIDKYNELFNDSIHCPDKFSYLYGNLTLSNDKNALLEMIISTIHDVEIPLLSNHEICLFGKSIQLLFENMKFISPTQKLMYQDKIVCLMFLINPFDFIQTHIIFDIYLQLAEFNQISALLFYHYSVSFLTNILNNLLYKNMNNMTLYCLFTLSDLFHLCENCGLLFDKENILIIDVLSTIQMDHKTILHCAIPCIFPLLSLRYSKLSSNE